MREWRYIYYTDLFENWSLLHEYFVQNVYFYTKNMFGNMYQKCAFNIKRLNSINRIHNDDINSMLERTYSYY